MTTGSNATLKFGKQTYELVSWTVDPVPATEATPAPAAPDVWEVNLTLTYIPNRWNHAAWLATFVGDFWERN